MVEYTSLLKRQLRKVFGDSYVPDGPMEAFLLSVNDAYQGFEADQRLMERSLEVSSEELNETNAHLTQELEQDRSVLSRLRKLAELMDEGADEQVVDGTEVEENLLQFVDRLTQLFHHYQASRMALQQAKEQAELIYKVVPSAIFTTDIHGVITSWNAMAERITGHRQEEVLGRPRSLLAGPDGSFNSVEAAVGLGRPQRCTILTKNRRTRIISKNVDLLRNPAGEVIGGIESFEDITQQQLDQQQLKNYQDHLEELVEARTVDLSRANKQLHKQIKIRKAVESQLRSSQEKYELLAENLQETVFRLSPSGYFQYVSRGIYALAGYDARDLEGVNIHLLFDQRSEFVAAYRRLRLVQQKKIPQSLTFHIRRKDGRVFSAEMTVAPLIKDSQVVAVQGALRDITARQEQEDALRQAKEAAEQANRAKSTFLSTISHEIRTPLHCILGLAELVLSLTPPEDISHMLDSILNESQHLLSLINMLLDHAKIEAGKLDLVMMPFDLHKLSLDLDPLMRSMALPKELEIKVLIGETVPEWIVGDSMRIRQVLMNIVGNAVKFTHEGFVHLVLREVKREQGISTVEFEVRDSGVGIPADKLATVFDSFTQVDGRISRKYGGTGLGTTITKQLVGLMGGSVELESAEGVGTIFRVIMPLTVASDDARDVVKAASSQEVLCAERSDRKYRVLVAEDNENGQMLARLHLESAGYEVDIAADGVEEVELFRKGSYDLVLTDVQMPQMDGFEAARAIRAIETERGGGHVPVVAMTANADTAAHQCCMDAGMNDVLTKPMRRKQLLEVAARWLRAGDAARALVGEHVSLQTPVVSSVNSDAVFNYREAVEEFGGNQKLLRQAVKQYRMSTEKQVELMRAAYAEGELETVRQIAHKLRGASANITASLLQETAGNMEKTLLAALPKERLLPLFEEWDQRWRQFAEKLARDSQCAGLS
jgi:two-component system, sensor histidine kinase and response regulator